MFVVVREKVYKTELLDYNIVGLFMDMENAKKFVHKCIEEDLKVIIDSDEKTYCIYDFRSIPRCYRYVIREVRINETICD